MRLLSVLILVLMAIACVGNDPAVVPNDAPTVRPTATRYPEATMQAAVSTAMPTPTPNPTPTETPIPTVVPTPTPILPESCSNGVAVAYPLQNRGLVSDCRALLEAKDVLSGNNALNWSPRIPMKPLLPPNKRVGRNNSERRAQQGIAEWGGIRAARP